MKTVFLTLLWATCAGSAFAGDPIESKTSSAGVVGQDKTGASVALSTSASATVKAPTKVETSELVVAKETKSGIVATSSLGGAAYLGSSGDKGAIPVIDLEAKLGVGTFKATKDAAGWSDEKDFLKTGKANIEYNAALDRFMATVSGGVEYVHINGKKDAEKTNVSGPVGSDEYREKFYLYGVVGGEEFKTEAHPVAFVKFGRDFAMCTPVAGKDKHLFCLDLDWNLGIGTELNGSATFGADYNYKIADDGKDGKKYFFVGPRLGYTGAEDFISGQKAGAAMGGLTVGVSTH